MELKDALLVLVSGGGGAVVFWLMEHVGFLKALRADYKRYAALALAALLPVVAWLLMMAMGYDQPPPTWQAWIEKMFALAAGALLVSQGIHGAARLSPRR